MGPELCKNCHQVHQGNFCHHCGQKTNTVRLNWAYLKDEANYTILHFNKGFLYTIKELFTRPGDTIREFLEGKRVKHYKPLLLVFVLAGINGYLASQIDMKQFIESYNQTNNMNKTQNAVFITEYTKFMKWVFGHWAFMEILALPIVSFVSWLSFKKWGYNYIENIIINSFATGQRLLFGIFTTMILLAFPLGYMSKYTVLTTIITFGLTIWTYVTLYKNKDSKSIVLRMLLFLFLLLTTAAILLIIFSIAFAIYLKNSGKI